jgi:SAM-dependent methyltransferase
MTEHETHDHLPYDPQETACQVEGILELLPEHPCRVLDLGCGEGRIAGPLLESVEEGRIHLVGVDCDPGVEDRFRSATGGRADFGVGDLLDESSLPSGPFDLVLVLGNLFMTIREPALLRASFAGILARLSPGGSLVIDDFTEGGWAELAAGRWADGTDESGTVQMIWIPGDPEFVVRMGPEVDPGSDAPKPGERVLRLWSRRELDDAAGLVGLSPGSHRPEHLLCVHHHPGR